MLGNFGAQGYDALSLSLFVWGMEISRTGGADHMQHTHTHTKDMDSTVSSSQSKPMLIKY